MEAFGAQALKLNLNQIQYLSEKSLDSQPQDFSDITLRYFHLEEKPRSQLKAHFGGIASVGTDENYVFVPEFFYAFRGWNQKLEVSTGRRIYNWSFLENDWFLDLWQPRFQRDFLNQEIQGLTGIFASLKQGRVHVMGFISPLFLPNQGMNFQEKEGSIESSNPWFVPLQSRLYFARNDVPIEYRLEKPTTSEVISQVSYGFLARLGDENWGGWSQLAMARKPMNKIHLTAQAGENIDRLVIEATVHPKVLYHNLGAIEAGYSTLNYKTYFSFQFDQPDLSETPKEWEEEEIFESYLLGGGLKHDFNFLNTVGQLKWSYLRIFQGERRSKDPTHLLENRDSFIGRFLHTDAAQVEWTGLVRHFITSKFNWTLRYIQNLSDPGSILSLKFIFDTKRSLSYFVGSDILGTTSQSSGFIRQFQSNDRIFGGLSYVF